MLLYDPERLRQLAAPQTPIHPATRLGAVALTVADLERSLDFYTRVIGLHVLRREGQSAVLGAGSTTLLTVVEMPGARPQPAYSTGLYHAALLVPSRADLGRVLLHLDRTRYPLQGFADHNVSEALYLADPDGNGLEIYRDVPRAEWQYSNGTLRMGTDPLDLQSIVDAVQDPRAPFAGLPDGTVIGHMHLRVGDLALAEAFYHRALGFDIMVRYPGALFLSAGGYHHHLGANIWQSRGAASPPQDSAGLREFRVMLPDETARQQVIARLDAAGVPVLQTGAALAVDDPWGTRLLLAVNGGQG